MRTRREVLVSLSALMAGAAVPSPLWAGDDKVRRSQAGKEFVRHAGLYIVQGQNAQSLATIGFSINDYGKEEIFRAFQLTLEHFEALHNDTFEEVKNEVRAGDFSQYCKWIDPRGHGQRSILEPLTLYLKKLTMLLKK
ncbi:MAG: hypothetical protein AAF549_00875 [Pseudomonadota bacterium]